MEDLEAALAPNADAANDKAPLYEHPAFMAMDVRLFSGGPWPRFYERQFDAYAKGEPSVLELLFDELPDHDVRVFAEQFAFRTDYTLIEQRGLVADILQARADRRRYELIAHERPIDRSGPRI